MQPDQDSQHTSSDTVVDLVRKARGGSHDAYESLVRLYWNDLLRYAAVSLPSLEDARDLAQDTFVTAWEKLRSLKQESMFKSWLYGICRNKIRNAFRDASKLHMTHLDATILEQIDLQTDNSPEAFSHMHQALASCVQQLPPETAEVVQLRYQDGLHVQEIAESRQMTPNAVSKILWRARQSLATCIAKQMGEKE